MCNSHCSVHPFTHNQAPPPNPYYSPSSYNQPCSLHMPNNNFVPPNNFYQQQQILPHSKSLDQYDGKMQPNGINQHRLSLDHNYKMNQHLSPSSQQQSMMPPPFDCIDSVAFNHPYNQPNARSPLPYNLSSNIGHHMKQEQYYPSPVPDAHYSRQYSGPDYYHQMMQQIPTPVSDYHPKSYDFTDSSSPAIQDNELISFGNEMRLKPSEMKLRSSLKKSTHSTSDSLDLEPEIKLSELRALKRNPVNANNDVKARDGIGNYQAWDYVFQNLEKDSTNSKNIVGNYDDKVAAELQLENLKLTSNGHGPPKSHHQKSNGVPHRMSETSMRPSPVNPSTSSQSKSRTKSVSTAAEVNNHEHKRTSSVMETTSGRSNNNVQKHKLPQQPQIIVPVGEWSCRFCTFLNPDAKKICDMCSKSKDFFNDVDKSPATATCV